MILTKKDFSLDFNTLKKKITKNTLALILTHYHIEPLEYHKIIKYCKSKGIYIIEDRAIAFRFAKIKENLDKRHFIFFSFSPFKFISTINLGAIVTNNYNFYKEINVYKENLIIKIVFL